MEPGPWRRREAAVRCAIPRDGGWHRPWQFGHDPVSALAAVKGETILRDVRVPQGLAIDPDGVRVGIGCLDDGDTTARGDLEVGIRRPWGSCPGGAGVAGCPESS